MTARASLRATRAPYARLIPLGLAAATAALGLASCTGGARPGFSAGDRWSIPLVGPLEDGLLLVPALVNGKGPYVFLVDTDAAVSIIDQEVAMEIGTRTGEGPKLLDENGVERDRVYAEILEWQLGTLSVTNRPAEIVAPSLFDIEGRRIHGVIGRDVLADSLTFSFDRDRGEITITTKTAFQPDPAWQRIGFSILESRLEDVETRPLSRKLVDATINGQRFKLHLDLGATVSQLRPRSWGTAKLVESPLNGSVVDEVGVPRKVTKQGIAANVTLRTSSSTDVAFIPYADRRWSEAALEGTLGLDFFKPFAVSVDWSANSIYLRPRAGIANIGPRLARWQSKTLAACANPACIKITLIDPTLSLPVEKRPATHPGVVASIVREPSASHLDLEVLVAVTAADGVTPLKWLIVNLPGRIDRALTHLSADYVGAITTVIDVSLFPRQCPSQGGCVDQIKPQQPFTPPSAAGVPDAAAPAPDAL